MAIPILATASLIWSAAWAYGSHPVPQYKLKHFVQCYTRWHEFDKKNVTGIQPLIATAVVSKVMDFIGVNTQIKSATGNKLKL